MVMEIVAGRIMAPFLGVSLYTWTSIIGVVMLGISLGNYLGGRVADKHGNSELLGMSFLFSGFSVLTIVIFSNAAGQFFITDVVPLPLATLFFSLLIFFLPSVMLSFITPIVIKLNLKNLGETGITVGRIYSFSALGSILGTFATGYFFIQWFGVRFIIMGVSVVLITIGALMTGPFIKSEGKRLFIVFFLIFVYSLILPNKCDVESNYYCIYSTEFQLENGHRAVALQLDHLVHGYFSGEEKNFLGYGYEGVYALAAEYFSEKKEPKFLMLGGGAYVLPRLLEENYPHASVEVAEIDKAVTEYNYNNLQLSRDTKIHTYNQDARIFLQKASNVQKYDVIFADVFNDLSIPYHLTTDEFNALVKSTLRNDGIYAVNIIDDYNLGSFLVSYIHTLKNNFEYIYLAPLNTNVYDIQRRYTYVVLASNVPVDERKWSVSYDELLGKGILDEEDDRKAVLNLVSGKELDEFIDGKKVVFLTDDYAPVDNMLAPVFRDR